MEAANGEESGTRKYVETRKRGREDDQEEQQEVDHGQEEIKEANGGENHHNVESRKQSRESSENVAVVLTEHEAAVYDRQIRVWGAEAQRRLSKGNVLIVGMSGVIAETCKNIVLAGLGSLTLIDDRPVTVEASFTNFLISSDEIERETKSIAAVCADSLREYNPMVDIRVDTGDIVEKPGEYFDNFDAVVLDKAPIATKRHVNDLCRSRPRQVSFYAVDCRHSCGSVFVDLQTTSYTTKKKTDSSEDVEGLLGLKEPDVKYTKEFPSFKEALAVRLDSLPKRTSMMLFANRIIDEFESREKRVPGQLSSDDVPALFNFAEEYLSSQGLNMPQPLEKLLQKIADAGLLELPPVSAIVGGILGQEIIKTLSGKGEPLKNYFFFNSTDGKGTIEDVSPPSSIPVINKKRAKSVLEAIEL